MSDMGNTVKYLRCKQRFFYDLKKSTSIIFMCSQVTEECKCTHLDLGKEVNSELLGAKHQLNVFTNHDFYIDMK